MNNPKKENVWKQVYDHCKGEPGGVRFKNSELEKAKNYSILNPGSSMGDTQPPKQQFPKQQSSNQKR